MIIYLPPDFDVNYSNYSPVPLQDEKSREPQVIITRIHKSSNNTLIIYQIESSCTEPPIPENSIICLSSQANATEIKNIYRELNFRPLNELSCDIKLVNVFGVLLEMSLKSPSESNKYAQLLLFDFDINKPITVKLWRGLSAWITSLSIGCRLQIRNLHFKENELHSGSNSEICLLAHGNNFIKDGKLSSRAYNLNEKEKEILCFLNHQSLLIKPQTFLKSSSNPKSLISLSLSPQFYLEYIEKCWILQGASISTDSSQIVSVRFDHIDARIWQQLNELFIDSSKGTNTNDFIINFTGLIQFDNYNNNNDYLFTCESTLRTEKFLTTTSINRYKCLNWDNLVSSKSILYGTYTIEGILESTNAGNITIKSSEESLGNLSLIPESNNQLMILKDPMRPYVFIYPDLVNNYLEHFRGQFIINVKTILNDGGNVNEIIRKSVIIINKACAK